MARSLSPSPERAKERSRKRERSHSPRDHKKEKKSRKSHKRSRSPREDRSRARAEEKPPKSVQNQEEEEGELPEESEIVNGQNGVSEISAEYGVTPENGHARSKSKQNGRSKSKDRHRSKSRQRARSRSREKGRDKSRERHRSKSRDRHRSRDRKRRSRSREKRRPSPGEKRHRSRSKDGKRGQSREKSTAVGLKEEGLKENGEIQENEGDVHTKAEPLSLDELMKKRKEEEEALAKPKFLSKKERQELALQRLKERRETEKKGTQSSVHDPFRNSSRSANQSRYEAERRAEEGRQKAREEREKEKEDREREKELEVIRKQYLGTEKVKKKIRKPSEKFHLNFDWEATDDTSKDLNPIYNNTHESIPLFGTGRRAGVDIQEQKTQAAEHRNQLQKRLRLAQGLEETEEDRKRDRERRRQAQKYDSQANKNAVKEHWSNKSREEMTERDWRIFREDFNISYKGVNVSGDALPCRNWTEAALPEELMKAIKELGYKKPSPIQMASIPLGLLQRDIIGVAETGSGKTASFVLPMLCYIKRLPVMTEEIAAQGPYAVIMAPVRELAQQIEEEAMKLAKHTPYRTVSVVGGQEISEQAFKLRKGCEIVVATPGRLKDCIDQSYAVLNQCNYVVLDEADRMIDMGFEPQVVAVLDAMPSSNLKPEDEDGILEKDRVYRTTYMFSATMPPPVERLARKYMRRPAVINIGSAGKATDNVTQKVYMIKDNEKLSNLEVELNQVNEKRTIVFVNTKKSCDTVSRRLDELGYNCTVLHGSKTQDQREQSLQGFREEKYNVLVATDVAGRGIDVPDVALVINYDMPNAIDLYTHRIGRTARAGKAGTAITFLTPQDTDMYYELKKFLEDSKASIPSSLLHHEAAKRPPDAEKSKRETTVYARK